jgi:hypothetical protein
VQIHPVNIKQVSDAADVGWLIISIIGVVGLLTGVLWSGYRAFVTDDTLKGVMVETAKTSSLVFIILLGAAMLTAAFRGFGGEDLVREFLTGLPGGFWGQFITVMAVIFVLGFFLDFIEIAVVVVPIVAPILLTDPQANVTAVWLGVMIGVNIQTSFLTPPFGFALFYLRGVAPAFVKTLSMYKGVIPFICMQLLVLAIVGFSPRLVNYLPHRVTLSASTAPPPVNPGLQYCIEQYVSDQFEDRGDEVRAAITRARGLDLSPLPEALRKDLTESFKKAEAAFGMIAEVNKAEAAIDQRTRAYTPLHHRAREVEADIRRIEAELRQVQEDINRTREEETAQKQALDARRAALETERNRVRATLPAEWQNAQKEFKQLQLADRRARLTYRRTVDDAYEPVQNVVRIIASVGDLGAVKKELEDLRGIINSQPVDSAAESVSALSRQLNQISGARPISSELSKVRRSLTGRTADKNEALKALDATLQAYEKELGWRRRSADQLLAELRRYEEAIHDTIGIRKQERVPAHVVPAIAACTSHHRDISLQF